MSINVSKELKFVKDLNTKSDIYFNDLKDIYTLFY